MGKGSSTASQTGWALMALLATDCDEYQQHVRRGVHYLTSTQRDGTWHEPEYTGTGFPGYGVGARTSLDRQDLKRRLGQGRGAATRIHDQLQHVPPLFSVDGTWTGARGSI